MIKESALPCPACQGVAMKKYGDPQQGLVIDGCPECKGVWFDGGELRRFFQSDSLRKRFLLDRAAPDSSFTYSLSSSTRACPRCRMAMDQPVISHVTVDVCRGCEGIWLDYGELSRLVSDYRKSGLVGDAAVIEEVRQGLSGGKLGPGPLHRLLDFLRYVVERIFSAST